MSRALWWDFCLKAKAIVWFDQPSRAIEVGFRANVAHVRQSRPDYGLGFQVKVRGPFQCVPSALESEGLSWWRQLRHARFFWGWAWLSDAEAATNDGFLPEAAPRV